MLEADPLPSEALIGIAHTRWATNGKPTDANAHPHLSCRGHVAVVHNGIITNSDYLREVLRRRGHVFRSETDTEVLAHLIGEYLNGSPLEAVRTALSEVEGAYGLVVLFRDFPGQIVFARRGSPLRVGYAEGAYYVASDTRAYRQYTDQETVLEDGQMGVLTSEGVRIVDADSLPISPKVETVEWGLEDVELGGHPHFMHAEIMRQSKSLGTTLAGRLSSNGVVHLGGLFDHSDELRRQQNHVFIAAGTSLYAGMVGHILIQEVAGLPSQWVNASELANQERPCFPSGTGFWAVSQSGETADVLRAMDKAEELNRTVFGLCNVPGSSVARRTRGGVFLHAGPEIGVASTKAFTSQVLALNLIALYLRQLHQRPGEEWVERYSQAMLEMPSFVGQVLECDSAVQALAAKYQWAKNFLYLGRGINYPVALEAALKLKEISYIHAEGYPCAEMKHGPIALIDERFPTIVIVPRNDLHYAKILSNIEEIRTRGGPVIAIATEGDERIAGLVDDVIYVPKIPYYLTPLMFIIPLQLFAYHMAVLLGRNVDRPRNLAKSVTVE
jgi:glucosamine--fructose-6-phosphate aminotransferase (isomerizing)